MSIQKIAARVAAVLSLAASCALLAAGCQPKVIRDSIDRHTHRLDRCGECLDRSCMPEIEACKADRLMSTNGKDTAPRCQCLMGCRLFDKNFAESLVLCGGLDDAYSAFAACLDNHCPNVCPKENMET